MILKKQILLALRMLGLRNSQIKIDLIVLLRGELVSLDFNTDQKCGECVQNICCENEEIVEKRGIYFKFSLALF